MFQTAPAQVFNLPITHLPLLPLPLIAARVEPPIPFCPPRVHVLVSEYGTRQGHRRDGIYVSCVSVAHGHRSDPHLQLGRMYFYASLAVSRLSCTS